MISIVMAIILGIGFTIFATQNSGNVNFNLFGNLFTIPTYIFAAVCFLIGAGIAMIFNLFDLIAVASDRDARVHNQIIALQNENAKLRQELRGEKINRTKENIKNFFKRNKPLVG